jgi:hypothetical protein
MLPLASARWPALTGAGQVSLRLPAMESKTADSSSPKARHGVVQLTTSLWEASGNNGGDGQHSRDDPHHLGDRLVAGRVLDHPARAVLDGVPEAGLVLQVVMDGFPDGVGAVPGGSVADLAGVVEQPAGGGHLGLSVGQLL